MTNSLFQMRHFPSAKVPWLRYQVGYAAQKHFPYIPERRAADGSIIQTGRISRFDPVFHLKGWGETENDALKMAQAAR